MSKRVDRRKGVLRAPGAVPGGGQALRALTGGALALPGLVGHAHADSAVTQFSGSVAYSRYQEADAKSSDVAVGDKERYEIDVVQVQFQAPLGDDRDMTLDFVYEGMSGASPWSVVPDPNSNDVELVMSGASIEDNRYDVLGTFNFYEENGKSNLSAGLSIEDDYRSLNLGGGLEHHFNEKHTTLSGGVGFSFDEVDPVDDHQFPPGTEFDVRDRDYKGSATLFGGLSQIVNRNTIVQTSLTYKYSRGFLDDPYKQVFFVDRTIFRQDTRPGGRHQLAWLTRLRRHSPRFHGTLHLDYQFHWDSWKVNSHTAEIAWYQDLFGYAKLVPSFRYYTQDEAKFYAPYFEELPSVSHYSSDYRLSAFGAISYEAALMTEKLQIGRFVLEGKASWMQYFSDSDYAINQSDFPDNPGLVNFWVASIGLTGRF